MKMSGTSHGGVCEQRERERTGFGSPGGSPQGDRRGSRRAAGRYTGTILTEQPNAVWASDHTLPATVEDGSVTVLVAVDHCTTECVGLHAAKKATRFEALEPLRQGVRDYCGGFRAGAAAGIRNRHDHGSPYMSDDYQAEIAFSGMQSSPSFVRQPEGNG